MSDPYIGEIRLFGINFAPLNYAFCNGQTIPISQNAALFAVVGTTYGGDGQTTFALPNLQGLAAMSFGNGPGLTPRNLGEQDGAPAVTLSQAQMPMHNHNLFGATTGDPADRLPKPATDAYLSSTNPTAAYSTNTAPNVDFAPTALSPAGNSLPHENMQPYLAINFCIALYGIFPPRN